MSRSSPITAQQWSQVQRLLDELELLPRSGRRDALQTREILDARVRAEVESLLDAEARSGDFLEDSPWLDTQPRSAAVALPPGTVLGSFRVEDLIGRGGMAEVYRAQRIGEFDQRVAIKLISGNASTQLDAFQRERRILATLEHTGIARIVDGGITEAGRSYMVMEYVEGTDLVRHAQERRLDLGARLDLFRQVCEAVSFAHRHLIIHRDLKPGNIRVTPGGQVKLLDFGVAKLLQTEGRTEDFETATILTPEFAAPEQLYGQPVSTATDVYALGAVLFHLLCGVPPFRAEGRAMHLVIDQMLRSEMPQPSSVAAAQPDPPVTPRLLRGDIDAIVARATRKKPADRYPTVDELWADLARHLAHLPVAARRGNTLYEIGRSLRRHRVAVGAGAAITLVVVAGLVSTLWQARAALRAQSEALAQAERAARTKDFFVATFASASALHRTDESPVRLSEALDDALERIDKDLSDQPRFQADLLSDFGEIRLGQGDLPGAKDMIVRALALHENLLAPDDPVLAKTLQRRGSLDTYFGDDLSALNYLQRAQAIFQQHPDQADELQVTRGMIAMVDYNQGRYQLARDRFAQTIAYARAHPEQSERWLGDSLIGVAASAMELQRVPEARSWSLEALALVEKRFGANSVHNVSPLRLLGRLEHEAGDRKAERSYRERALALARLNYPGGHPDVVASLLDVGVLELETGNPTRAEALLSEAAQMSRAEGLTAGAHTYRSFLALMRAQYRRDHIEDVLDTAKLARARCPEQPGSDARLAGFCEQFGTWALQARLTRGGSSALLAQAQSSLDRLLLLQRDATLDDAADAFAVARARLVVALAQSALGQHVEAAASLREVVRTHRQRVGGIGSDPEGARWLLVSELAAVGTPEALTEAGKILKSEQAAPGTDEARRLLALAEWERGSGHTEIASAHAQAALRLISTLDPGEGRLQARASELAASLQ